MKFISVALLAPVVLAAPQASNEQGWIGLLKEQCSDMPQKCLDIAKQVHEPQFDFFQAGQATLAMPACTPAYVKCIQDISPDSDVSTFSQPGAGLTTCLLQIAPDHIKYFLDNDKADIPIPAQQNCALRELHRVAHVELGPLA